MLWLFISVRVFALSTWREPYHRSVHLITSISSPSPFLRSSPPPPPCSIAHPYLLADNRHFTFYLWRRVISPASLPAQRYAWLPLYALSLCALRQALGEQTVPRVVLSGSPMSGRHWGADGTADCTPSNTRLSTTLLSPMPRPPLPLAGAGCALQTRRGLSAVGCASEVCCAAHSVYCRHPSAIASLHNEAFLY